MGDNVKREVINHLMKKVKPLDLSESDIDMQSSLMTQGVLDSISFLEFAMELEATFEIDLDFSGLDPTEFTSVEGLTKLIENEI